MTESYFSAKPTARTKKRTYDIMPYALSHAETKPARNGELPARPARQALVYPALRFVERNQKGNYFRETQYTGRSDPDSSIGWFWSNDTRYILGTCHTASEPDTHSRLISPSVAKCRQCTSGNPFPSLVSIEKLA